MVDGSNESLCHVDEEFNHNLWTGVSLQKSFENEYLWSIPFFKVLLPDADALHIFRNSATTSTNNFTNIAHYVAYPESCPKLSQPPIATAGGPTATTASGPAAAATSQVTSKLLFFQMVKLISRHNFYLPSAD